MIDLNILIDEPADIYHEKAKQYLSSHGLDIFSFQIGLGGNYYRTQYTLDTLGRQVAVSKMASVGKWQVEAVKYDWQGRPTAQLKGVGMNPPTIADIYEPGRLATVSEIQYEGQLQSEQRSYFDTDKKSFTRTKFVYDAWQRVRARYNFDSSGMSIGPFSVQDYDWRGYTTASAQFMTEPNWAEVIASKDFAATSEAGRRSLSKTYTNGNGNVFRTEIFEVANDGKAGKCATNTDFQK
jgi:hypothetical protein